MDACQCTSKCQHFKKTWYDSSSGENYCDMNTEKNLTKKQILEQLDTCPVLNNTPIKVKSGNRFTGQKRYYRKCDESDEHDIKSQGIENEFDNSWGSDYKYGLGIGLAAAGIGATLHMNNKWKIEVAEKAAKKAEEEAAKKAEEEAAKKAEEEAAKIAEEEAAKKAEEEAAKMEEEKSDDADFNLEKKQKEYSKWGWGPHIMWNQNGNNVESSTPIIGKFKPTTKSLSFPTEEINLGKIHMDVHDTLWIDSKFFEKSNVVVRQCPGVNFQMANPKVNTNELWVKTATTMYTNKYDIVIMNKSMLVYPKGFLEEHSLDVAYTIAMPNSPLSQYNMAIGEKSTLNKLSNDTAAGFPNVQSMTIKDEEIDWSDPALGAFDFGDPRLLYVFKSDTPVNIKMFMQMSMPDGLASCSQQNIKLNHTETKKIVDHIITGDDNGAEKLLNDINNEVEKAVDDTLQSYWEMFDNTVTTVGGYAGYVATAGAIVLAFTPVGIATSATGAAVMGGVSSVTYVAGWISTGSLGWSTAKYAISSEAREEINNHVSNVKNLSLKDATKVTGMLTNFITKLPPEQQLKQVIQLTNRLANAPMVKDAIEKNGYTASLKLLIEEADGFMKLAIPDNRVAGIGINSF
jgi:hypothetical protein